MRFYICEYCYKDFEPTRRRVQKYCSNTCRSKAHHARKTSDKKSLATKEKDTSVTLPELKTQHPKTKIESMSLAGMGNAAAGNLAADAVKSLLTPIDNKPATKGDLKKLTEKLINRYHFVSNMPQRYDGALPYFDIETGEINFYLYPPYIKNDI